MAQPRSPTDNARVYAGRADYVLGAMRDARSAWRQPSTHTHTHASTADTYCTHLAERLSGRDLGLAAAPVQRREQRSNAQLALPSSGQVDSVRLQGGGARRASTARNQDQPRGSERWRSKSGCTRPALPPKNRNAGNQRVAGGHGASGRRVERVGHGAKCGAGRRGRFAVRGQTLSADSRSSSTDWPRHARTSAAEASTPCHPGCYDASHLLEELLTERRLVLGRRLGPVRVALATAPALALLPCRIVCRWRIICRSGRGTDRVCHTQDHRCNAKQRGRPEGAESAAQRATGRPTETAG